MGEEPAINERPVRGDNRTGQAIWALGVDGRSRRIQPRWGGITAPTDIGRRRVAVRSKRPAFFLAFPARIFGPKLLRPGAIGVANGRLFGRHCASRLVQGPGCGNILQMLNIFSRRCAGHRRYRHRRPVTAETAAKASASSAPNISSRPGEPRSRAVFIRIARTSPGFNAGLHSSIRAARPLM